jgi:hypothetical protein
MQGLTLPRKLQPKGWVLHLHSARSISTYNGELFRKSAQGEVINE